MHPIPALSKFREGKPLDEAAKELGVNKTTLLRWEQGKVRVPQNRLIEVGRVTGIPPHVLRPDLADIFGPAPTKEAV